jgi:hypothetical protein
MARYVPASARRDLKPPAFLHLDPAERFPRVTLRRAGDGLEGLFGPFRDRRAAEKARNALHKLVPLRPCDYTFEPDPALPLGLGCLYAQVRSCAAPCLRRTSEEDYRGLATGAARILAGLDRPAGVEAWLPPWVAPVSGRRGLVVATPGQSVHLFPVREGTILDGRAVKAPVAELEDAVGGLSWDPPADPPDDWAWLAAWLHAPRRREAYLVLEPDEGTEAVTARVRAVVGERAAV